MFKSSAFDLCDNIPNVNTDDAVETCALDIEVCFQHLIRISARILISNIISNKSGSEIRSVSVVCCCIMYRGYVVLNWRYDFFDS